MAGRRAAKTAGGRHFCFRTISLLDPKRGQAHPKKPKKNRL
jgi:hypothetical protein